MQTEFLANYSNRTYVHKEENRSTLQISFDVVHDYTFSDVDDFDVGERRVLNTLVSFGLDLYSIPIVLDCLLRCPTCVLYTGMLSVIVGALVFECCKLTSGLCNLTARILCSTMSSEQIDSMKRMFLISQKTKRSATLTYIGLDCNSHMVICTELP